MPTARSLLRPAALALGLLTLAACAPGGSVAVPVDRFYRLDPPPVATALPSPVIDGPLVVDIPESEGMTNERPILYANAAAPTEVRQYSYQYWVDAPTRLVQDRLMVALRQANVAPIVVTPEVRTRPAAELSSKLRTFEQRLSGTQAVALVEVEVHFTDLRTGRLKWIETFAAEREADSPDMLDTVEAFNAAFGDISAQIVARLADG